MAHYSDPSVYEFAPLGSPIAPLPDELDHPNLSDYERQEMTRHLRQARRSIIDLVSQLADLDAELVLGEVPHRAVTFGQRPEQIVDAIASLRCVSNDAHHRVAVAADSQDDVDEIRAYLDGVDRMGANVDHEDLHTIVSTVDGEEVWTVLRASTLRRLVGR